MKGKFTVKLASALTLLCLQVLTLPMYGQYCSPVYSSACTSDDYINNFTFNTISNLGTGCTGTLPSNLTYYSALSTTVMPGMTYPISMQSGPAWSQGFGVWIDYNIDGDFADAGEFVFASATSTTALVSGTVTIPAVVTPGLTRMRVRCRYASTVTATQYCSSFSFGETEDYNVMIGTPSAIDPDITAIPAPVSLVIGPNPITFTITNMGTSSLNGTPITCQYSTDGGTTWPVTQTFTPTTLASLGTTQNFTFATAWNVATSGTYNVCVRINPNVPGDPDATNSFCKSVCTGLSGVFTINGGLPTGGTNYNSFTAAVSALSGCGITGPVTFNVAPGTYFEQINIPAIAGSSVTNTVTFNGTSAAACTLSFMGSLINDYVVRLNGADNMRFQNLTVQSTGVSYGYVFHLTNTADRNIIQNCVIDMPTSSTSSYHIGVLISGTSYTTYANNGNRNIIQNNVIKGGYYGVRMNGTNTSTRCAANRVLNNQLLQQYYYGVYSIYQDSSNISNNLIRLTTTAGTFGYAIYLRYNDRQFTVEKNNIQNGKAYGIYMSSCNTTSLNPSNVCGNMITGTWLSSTPYGIYAISTSRINYHSNSINMNSANFRGLYMSSGTNNQILNNIFSSTTTASTGYAMYVVSATSITACNFNDYWTAGSNWVYLGGVYTTMAALQAAYPAYNTNSVRLNPLFISNSNLHLGCSPMNNIGTPTSLLADLDGNARSATTPDIGADEFNPLSTSVSLGPDTTACGEYTVAADTTWSTFLWSTGATTRMITTDTSGIFWVTVTDTFNCSATDTIEITIDTLPSEPFAADTLGYCPGAILDALNTGASFLWSTGATTQTIALVSAGWHSVTITNGFGCSISDSIFIDLFAQPTVNLGPDTTFCVGGSYLLDAGNPLPGFTYLWSTGATTQLNAVTGPGTYWVQVTSPLGCADSDTVVLNLTPAPVPSLGPDRIECNGFTLDAGNPGATYLWNTGATTQTIIGTMSGLYIVRVISASGCEIIDSVNIVVAPTPTVTLGADRNVCNGVPVALDAGNPGSSYLWNNGATTQIINVTAAGTYVVAVTNPTTGCVGYDTVEVTVSNLSVELGSGFTLCTGKSVTLNAGNPGSTYTWSTGATTQTIDITAAGTYSVIVTDAFGCTATDAITVTTAPGITAAFTASATTVPLFTPITFTDGSTPTPSSYLWSFGDGNTSTAANPTYTYAAVGTYNVRLIVSNGTGCQDTTFLTVNVGNPIGIDEDLLKGSFTLYPNPNQGQFTMDFDLTEAQDLIISVVDMQGRTVFSETMSQVTVVSREMTLNIPVGMYFLQLETSEGLASVTKLIVE